MVQANHHKQERQKSHRRRSSSSRSSSSQHHLTHQMLLALGLASMRKHRPCGCTTERFLSRPVPSRPVPSRPVPSRLEKKYNRPVPPRKKNTTAPSRLGKKNNRPVPLREKKATAPSRLGKKQQPPRPASKKKNNRPVPPRISTPIFCQSRAPAEMKKVGQPSIFPPSRPVEILAVHVKP